jgi:2-oxoisovalerate dehydrogenase E1 component alpha subunit
MMEALVSRLYGHSSASGANFVANEVDCLKEFEAKLEKDGVLTRQQMDELRNRYTEDLAAAARLVRDEPQPAPETIWNHIYAEKK